MKNIKLFLLLLLPFFLFSQEKEKRLALVIGNSEYIKGPLKNPVNDASLIAKTLEDLDFEVMLYKNLETRSSMLKAISEFGLKRPLYDVGFVYYAGHGIQVNSENFLIPTNELINNKLEVEDYAVSLQKILRYLESSGTSSNINFLVLDACRDNPYEMSWSRSSKGNGLAKVPPPTGSLIAFSTDSNQTAADGDGENSLYSLSLSKNLRKENISIEQVFKNVLTEVIDESKNTQSPVYESKLTGSTYALNRTFSIYNSTVQEIMDFSDNLLKKRSLLDALKILDDAANYYNSEKEIKSEIEIRSKIINSYLFYESQENIDIELELFKRFDFNFNTVKNIRLISSEMFNDLFDKSSYDIFSKNYSFLLSINKKEYLNNINYQELIPLAYFYYYQMEVLTSNNENVNFFEGLILNPISLTEIENFIKKNEIELETNPLLTFWRDKIIYLNFRFEYYSDLILISSLDELNNTLKEYHFDIFNALKKISASNKIVRDSDSDNNTLLNKVATLTLELYPNLLEAGTIMANDVLYFSNFYNNQGEFYEIFKSANKDIIDQLSTVKTTEFFIEDHKNKIQLDINWFLKASGALFTNLIYNFGVDNEMVKDLLKINKNNLSFIQNYDHFLDELLMSKNNVKIDKYNRFVKNNSFRLNAYLNYRDYVFNENEIEIDSLFKNKITNLKEINNDLTIEIEKHVNNYNSLIEEDYTDTIKYIDDFFNYPAGLGGNFSGFYYGILQYLKNSTYSKDNNVINSKMQDYERKLKLNQIIKNALLTYQSALDGEMNGTEWIRSMELSQTLNFYTKLLEFTEFNSDEYLIISYFLLDNIIRIDKSPSITWEFENVVNRYKELTALAESKDDYLFKINIQQKFDEFLLNIDSSKYSKVYSKDKLFKISEEIKVLRGL